MLDYNPYDANTSLQANHYPKRSFSYVSTLFSKILWKVLFFALSKCCILILKVVFNQ